MIGALICIVETGFVATLHGLVDGMCCLNNDGDTGI